MNIIDNIKMKLKNRQNDTNKFLITEYRKKNTNVVIDKNRFTEKVNIYGYLNHNGYIYITQVKNIGC